MKYLPFIFLLTLFFACGDPAPSDQPAGGNDKPSATPVVQEDRDLESPDIKINIQGAPAGQVNLVGMFTDQFYKADSVQLGADGTARLKRDEPYRPGFYYLQMPDQKTTFQLLIDDDQTFNISANMADLANTVKVEGSLDNQLHYQTMKFEDEQRPKFAEIGRKMRSAAPNSAEYKALKAEQDALSDERIAYLENIFTKYPNALYSKFKKAGQNPVFPTIKKSDGSIDTAAQVYVYRTTFWDNVDFNDERLLWTPVISNKLKKYINELTGQNPDSIRAAATFLVDRVMENPAYYKYFANWIVLNYEPTKTTLMDSEAVYVHMIENYFTYERAHWSDSVEVHGLQLRAYEMSASLVGKKGRDVKANDPNGNPHSIYEMKSPYILVYMWNPECEHCAEQTPKLVQNYNSWKSQGLDIFGIGINTEDQAWKDAIKRYGMQWTNVMDPTNKAIYAKYYVDNTPELYVLNPDRTIIGKTSNGIR